MKKLKTKWLILSLAIITLIAVGVTVWALFFRQPATTTGSDYAPKQIEQNADKVEDEDNSKLETPAGGGAVSLTYSKEVALSLDKKEAVIMFQNPSKSNQDMVIELQIDGKTITKSGRLPAGYKLQKLSNVDTDKLSAGNYDGKFVMSYYNTKTGEKAVVNTEIPVTITVKN